MFILFYSGNFVLFSPEWPALARQHSSIIMLCKDLDIYGYKPTLSQPGLGQGHKLTCPLALSRDSPAGGNKNLLNNCS